MRSHASDELRVPADLWARPDTQQALSDRDIGRLFVLVRRYAGASQTRIGAAVGLSQGTVSDIMAGKRRVESGDVLVRIANGLGMPTETRLTFGLAPAYAHMPTKPDESPSAPVVVWGDLARQADDQTGKTDWMLRRTVLTSLAALGAGAAVSSFPDADLAIGSYDDWQEIAWEYGYAYLTRPRAELLNELGPDLAAARRLVATATDESTAGPMAAVAARLAGLVAMACTDLQWSREARHAWRLARTMARQSNDPGTQLWVHGNETTLGIYQGRPLPVLLALADQAIPIGDQQAFPGRAELLSGKAQALAMLGQRTAAIALLDEAQRVLAALPDAITAETESIFGWPERRLRHAESFVYARVGRPDEADQAYDRVMALYPASRVISRSQIQMHRAISLIRRGEIAGGIDFASTALQNLPTERRRQFVLAVASHVLAAVPESERHRPEIDHYRDQLAYALEA